MGANVDDTYAEAFRSIYAEVLITARDRTWLDHAVAAATGNASSSILCDCEAGLDRYVGPGGDASFATPDGRPGAVVQFHVPRFRKDRAAALERSLLVRLSQNVLTCPTTACFNLLDEPAYFKLGRKIAFFGDGYQYRTVRFGRPVWVVPILSGEFVLDRRFGYRDGLMGGNLWLMGRDADAALNAAERAAAAARAVPGVILPFPGGVAASGSKAGSRYKFAVASTYAEFCPTLRDQLGARSQVPAGVASIQEIIINGRDLPTIARATPAAIAAAIDTPGLARISAGNYGGRLGKSFVYLRPERQPADQIHRMRITDVRACQPRCPSPPDWRTSLGQILVAVDTDAGLTGYGVGGGGLSAIHIVRTVLRDLLLGQSPEPVETLWQAMYRATLAFGRKGVAVMALSGVDLALWDLRGKAERRSVAELLGGVRHRRMPTYGTAWDAISDDMLGRHRAYKLHLGRQPQATLVEATARARQRIGSDCPLMVDAWMQWDVPLTRRFAEETAALRLDWIEEPLPPDDLAGYAELVRDCPVPIAGGEHEFTAAAFGELIVRRLHHVLQPDVCWCGGMTELVKIYRLAAEHGVQVCPHRGAEVWALPALAALDPRPLAESGRPWLTWVGGQPPIEEGWIAAPDGVGFGVTIDEARLDILY